MTDRKQEAVASVLERLEKYKSSRNIRLKVVSNSQVEQVGKLGGVSRSSLMMPSDRLLKVNLGSIESPRLTYVSQLVNEDLFSRIKELLHEYKDCFAWDYTEMPGLNREFVEYTLPIRSDFKPVKQAPRRISREVMQMVFDEIKKLFKA